MKILQVNKFHHGRGGANRYYLELSRILEAEGHEVVHFSMKDETNEPSPFTDYFVENIDFHNHDGSLERLRCFGRVVYSFEARRKIERLLDQHRPEIAHLHNIYHHLSPSILFPLADRGIPVILTAHDYKLICPNYTLFDGFGVCENCRDGLLYKVATTRCHGSSLAMGLTLAVEAYLHSFLGSYRKHLDRIIVPSNFMGRKFAEFGVDPDKIVFIPNFVDPIPNRFDPASEENYLLYFGRLSGEKGLETLIRAMRHFPEHHLVIAGEGPERGNLLNLCRDEAISNVRFVGHKNAKEVQELIERSMFTVIPSIWYENCPLSILESMARGKPVIGARIGGIPELIEEGGDGLLFTPGDDADLSDKIRTLIEERDYRHRLGSNAFKKIGGEYNRKIHVQRIIDLYGEIIRKSNDAHPGERGVQRMNGSDQRADDRTRAENR